MVDYRPQLGHSLALATAWLCASCVAIERGEPLSDISDTVLADIGTGDIDVSEDSHHGDAGDASDAKTTEVPSFCASPGQMQCDGAFLQECVDQVWMTIVECNDGYVCEGASCRCAIPCGSRECGDDSCGLSCGKCGEGSACEGGFCIEQCVPDCQSRECGDDGCGGSCGTCSTALACDDASGQCVESASCPELLECQSDCVRTGGEVQPCTEKCLELASINVASEFNVVGTCIATSGCENLDCLGQMCGSVYANCYFDGAGPLSCGEAAGCVQNCEPPTDSEAWDACFYGCLEDSTLNAQLEWVQVSLCLGTYCPPNSEPQCNQAAAANQCKAPYEACFGLD